jgi:hypothetical protein
MITKNNILTELYNSGQLQHKLIGIMKRHNIPGNAEIQDDIIQTTFLHLTEYDTIKMIDAYTQNPKRILALGVTIMLRKCILKDNRYNNPKHSLAEYILYGSPLKSYNSSITPTDEFDEYLILSTDEKFEDIDDETDYFELWQYVLTQLNKEEKILLNNLLLKNKVPNKDKKSLNKKIKEIIINKNNN